MDIKIHGLTPDIIREAISRTKEAREHILTDVMEPVISTPRDHVGEYAPKIMQMHVDPDKISEIIGKQERQSTQSLMRQALRLILMMREE